MIATDGITAPQPGHGIAPVRTAATAARGAIAAPQFAVVIPTLNERANIAPLVEVIDTAMAGHDYEILFVDDWSRDGTIEAVRRIAARRADVRLIVRQGRRGLSSAVIEGALATSAATIAVMDADMQHDERLLPLLLGSVAAGEADVAIGSRYCTYGSAMGLAPGRLRASRLAVGLAKRLLKVDALDPMSGFFAVRRQLVEDLAPRLHGGGFKILADILLTGEGLRTIEMPFVFRPRVAGASKLDAGVAIDYLRLLIGHAARRFAPPRLVLFALVGSIGLVVHLTVLRSAMLLLHAPFALAQAMAVSVAIVSNFALNNRLTFADRRLRGTRWWTGLTSFAAICGVGAIANVGIGSVVFAQEHRWLVAGIAGAIVGSLWNFVASSVVTWRRG